jgi:hypothetical protein
MDTDSVTDLGLAVKIRHYLKTIFVEFVAKKIIYSSVNLQYRKLAIVSVASSSK